MPMLVYVSHNQRVQSNNPSCKCINLTYPTEITGDLLPTYDSWDDPPSINQRSHHVCGGISTISMIVTLTIYKPYIDQTWCFETTSASLNFLRRHFVKNSGDFGSSSGLRERTAVSEWEPDVSEANHRKTIGKMVVFHGIQWCLYPVFIITIFWINQRPHCDRTLESWLIRELIPKIWLVRLLSQFTQ